MNKARREKLRSVAKQLEACKDIIENLCDEERDCVDNTPENLMGSEKYEKMEDAVDGMEDAAEQLEYAIEHIEDACGGW